MSLWFNGKKKIRAKEFLEQMAKVIPYDVFMKIIWEKYNKGAKTWRPKYDLKLLLKIHFLQNFYNLWDLAMEKAIYDRLSFSRIFVSGYIIK